MKKYITILIIGFFAFSCEDMEFIQENPNSDFILLDIDENSLEAIINGAYEPMTRSRGRLWESVYSTWLEQCTEYSYSRLSLFNDIALYEFDKLDASFNATMWTTFYESVGRANFIISNLEENTTLEESVRREAIGEALFIRAICYYSMVRTWGSLPLRTMPVANANEVELESSSISDIYEQIIADFQVAEVDLPATVPEAKAGRATRGAAKLALADVYLTLGDFANARTMAKEVIDNKATYGYELVSSLELLYSPSASTNTEEVFAIKFAQVNNHGNFLVNYSSGSQAAEAGIGPGPGNSFMHTYDDIPFITEWDDNDIRKAFNLYNEVTIDGAIVPANIPVAASNNIPGDFFFGKYQDAEAPSGTAAGNDFYLYRYADALLIFAEAENQVNGPTADAYDAINMVRRRGHGVDINAVSAIADLPAALSQNEFDDLVFRERGYEFFWECKRWFDLKRTGRWSDIAVAAGKPAPQSDYWPIPPVELANNPSAGN
ncbi:MAG: RagB/SusD family nutrient uptake outer membrane protein [Flavobacteriaceae bacterium]